MLTTPTIRELAEGLPEGASRRVVCPGCRGGRSGEASLSVTRLNDGIAYKCHRASCPVSGVRALVPGIGRVDPAPFVPRPYPFDLATPSPGHGIWTALRLPYDERVAARLGVAVRADDPSEVVWSIHNIRGESIGRLSRTYPEKRIRVWREVDGPFHNYIWTARKREALWIVEDNVGAARIAMSGYSALALLGTHFSMEARGELTTYLNDRDLNPVIYVALDPDAYDKGSQLARELTFRTGRVTMAVPTIIDPKDMSPEALQRMLDA